MKAICVSEGSIFKSEMSYPPRELPSGWCRRMPSDQLHAPAAAAATVAPEAGTNPAAVVLNNSICLWAMNLSLIHI